jgi:hypothetical protein
MNPSEAYNFKASNNKENANHYIHNTEQSMDYMNMQNLPPAQEI